MKYLMKLGTICCICLLATAMNAQAQVVIKVKPAQPKVIIVKGKAPKSGMIWIDGSWKWSKRHNKYIWIKARWIKTKRGHHWHKGHWATTKHGYKWLPGHWKRI